MSEAIRFIAICLLVAAAIFCADEYRGGYIATEEQFDMEACLDNVSTGMGRMMLIKMGPDLLAAKIESLDL